MSESTALAIAQLVIYSILCIPTTYNIIKHGKRGLLGWIYLLVFCVLRITGSAILLSSPTNSGTVVITNIRISPLLLATLGILHEARDWRDPNLNMKFEIPFVVALHILIATAVGLIASGAMALTSASPDPNSLILVKVGISTLLLSWVIIVVIAVASLLLNSKARSEIGDNMPLRSMRCRDGTRLLRAVLLSFPLTGLRVLYSVSSDFTQSASLNPVTGSLALRVCLSIVSEILAVTLFVVAGIWIRNVGRD